MATLVQHAKRFIKKLVDKPSPPRQMRHHLSHFVLARVHEQRQTFTYLGGALRPRIVKITLQLVEYVGNVDVKRPAQEDSR